MTSLHIVIVAYIDKCNLGCVVHWCLKTQVLHVLSRHKHQMQIGNVEHNPGFVDVGSYADRNTGKYRSLPERNSVSLQITKILIIRQEKCLKGNTCV